jgi:adenine-specific DNA-methyltransferase
MKSEIIKYLSKNISSIPFEVDKLIVSAYLKENRIEVKKNNFIKQFIISEAEVALNQKVDGLITLIKSQTQFNIETLIELFEFVISPSDRIINGAVYTPLRIREYIVDECVRVQKDNLENATFADIACGCGGFLFNVAKHLKRATQKSYREIFKNQIFGLDIQDYSITRSKILLTILALSEGEDLQEFSFNLHVGDTLNFNWNRKKGFDVIVGNPPYVCSRNIHPETKKLLSNWEVCSVGHPDLYIPFFQIGLELLANNGILGYITMNSFFKSLNGRALREYFKNNAYYFKIIDFGTEQIFNDRNTYTCICIIEKSASKFVNYLRPLYVNELHKIKINQFEKISYEDLDSKKGWNLRNNKIITKIESTGKSFGVLFKTRTGVATLKNDIYMFNHEKEDNKYYYLSNGQAYKIEKEICKNIINSNKLSGLNSIKGLEEKIIFPYEYLNDNKKPSLLNEEKFKKKYPCAFKYLESAKKELAKRDKGTGEYENWFAYGRNQSLEKTKNKLFIPHITDKRPNCVLNSDEELLFYNGLAVLGNTQKELSVLKKIMQSRLFWYYITNSSKPYNSNYFSLSRNYIKNFGIYTFTNDDIEYILREKNVEKLDVFFEDKYGISLA